MVRDEHKGGSVPPTAEPLEKLKEMFARRGIKPGAWFIQDQ